MTALGRILQLFGWLWLILAVSGNMFGFVDLNYLPGIILIFVARVMRNQGEQTEMPELGDGSEDEEEPEPTAPERMMNTERRRQAPPAIPEPEPAYVEPRPDAQPSPMKRNDLLEQIVGAGRQVEEVEEVEISPDTEPLLPEERGERPSSAEMIARAHERWDSRPR